MRVVFLSDTHMLHRKVDVPDGDVVIHCGDALNRGSIVELDLFSEWFGSLPHRRKLYVPGNHDLIVDEHTSLADDVLAANGIEMLIDQETVVEGLRVYGTPWTPTFGEWSFMKDDHYLGRYFTNIPEGLDILISHGPAYGILDKTQRGPLAGSRSLLKAIDRAKPRYHVFGHIHEAYGTLKRGETTHVCASICTLQYRPNNHPVIMDIHSLNRERGLAA